jgi:HD-GYP domain-containing protein (c-di-GMP phosphodiesterase class II)
MCDAWHAMTSDRPYRQALAPEAARAELERHVGTQFCPAATPALLRVLDRRTAPRGRPPLRPLTRACRRSGPTARSRRSCAP